MANRLVILCLSSLVSFPLISLASLSPQQQEPYGAVDIRDPLITPSPVLNIPSRVLKRPRNIISDLESRFDEILTEIGSDLPTWVVSGIQSWETKVPSGSEVQSSLGLDDNQVAALPTSVLNLGPYANWTDAGWNVRFHGNVYKTPDISESKLNDLANVFLIGTSVEDLPASEAVQARNVTSQIFVLQQDDERPIFSLAPQPTDPSSGNPTGSPQPVYHTFTFPTETTAEGDFDMFIPIPSSPQIFAGNDTARNSSIQEVSIWVNGTDTGNATAYLVPPTGITVISDIDDILRVTKIYEPEQGILNTFAKPFTPWMNMPQIYANWSMSIKDPQVHFHYLTTTPEQVTRPYESFISAHYPAGSFDTRPLNFSNIAETLSVRKYLLQKIFATFPSRQFVLVADTSNSDVMKDYPEMYATGQVRCIFLRNTSATDHDLFPYDTSGFKGIPQDRYMFFVTPDDLTGIDIVSGSCLNKTVKQNVTFGEQDELLGLHGSGAGRGYGAGGWGAAAALVLFAALWNWSL